MGFGGLLESQISDFERGKTLPSFGSLLLLLAACSTDGESVDFRVLQKALIDNSGSPEPAVVDKLRDIQAAMGDLLQEAVDLASEEKIDESSDESL